MVNRYKMVMYTVSFAATCYYSVALMHVYFFMLIILAHRRTASLPSGPLLDVGVLCMPSTPVFPKPAVFPSVSQFTRVLDETQNMFETEELALTGDNSSCNSR